MEKLLKLLTFLRLLDADNRLSLTNIAVWITLAKLVTSHNVIQPTDLGALLGALASYQGKRLIAAKVS